MIALLRKLDMRQCYLLLGGVFLLLVVASTSFLTLPAFKEYRSAAEEQASLPPLPADTAELQSMLSEREEAIASRMKTLHGDMANLPLREVESYVIDRLQGIAWNHDVSLQGVRPASGQTVDTFREVLFKLDVEGHYMDLFAWLKELRRELGFIVIKEYRMTSKRSEGDQPVLLVQMTMASYRKEPM